MAAAWGRVGREHRHTHTHTRGCSCVQGPHHVCRGHMQGACLGGQGWAAQTWPRSGPAHSTPLLCVQARCPPRMMSMKTLSIPWRNTRILQFLGMMMVKKGAGPRGALGGAGQAHPS